MNPFDAVKEKFGEAWRLHQLFKKSGESVKVRKQYLVDEDEDDEQFGPPVHHAFTGKEQALAEWRLLIDYGGEHVGERAMKDANYRAYLVREGLISQATLDALGFSSSHGKLKVRG